MLSITHIECIHYFRRGREWFNCLFPKIGQNEALVDEIASAVQKSYSAGVGQPAPVVDDRSFLVRTIPSPYRRWQLRVIGMLQEVLYVLAAVKPQGVFNTV